MRTLNVAQHNIIINGTAASMNDYSRQRIRAAFFYAGVNIDVRFSLPEPFQLNRENRTFLAPFDWGEIQHLCLPIDKGIDLFIAPSLEPFYGVPIGGLTILPEAVPEGGWDRDNPPRVYRPAIYLNASLATSDNTLTHELGHALLNTLAHNATVGNFMFDQPGDSFTAAQVERLSNSPFLL